MEQGMGMGQANDPNYFGLKQSPKPHSLFHQRCVSRQFQQRPDIASCESLKELC